MSDQGDSSSESSASPSGSASDLSERDFHASDVESFVGSDVSHLCSISDLEGLSESDSKASYEVPGDQATTERSSEASNLGGENNIFRAENLIVEQPTVDEGEVDQSIPGGRSIAHHTLNNHLCQFLSTDIETGGEFAGIIQLSAEIVHMKLLLMGKKLASEKAEDCCHGCMFNRYVQPGCAPDYWDQRSIDVHGILPMDPRITGADKMRIVWPQFLSWLAEHSTAAQPIFLVAWNGGTCNLKWLWRLTQAPNLQYSWPENVRYFIDPCHVIAKYMSCPLNETKSKTQGSSVCAALCQELCWRIKFTVEGGQKDGWYCCFLML
jgi:hypothetical protein